MKSILSNIQTPCIVLINGAWVDHQSLLRDRFHRGPQEVRCTGAGAPHGNTATHQDQVNAELLAFLRS